MKQYIYAIDAVEFVFFSGKWYYIEITDVGTVRFRAQSDTSGPEPQEYEIECDRCVIKFDTAGGDPRDILVTLEKSDEIVFEFVDATFSYIPDAEFFLDTSATLLDDQEPSLQSVNRIGATVLVGEKESPTYLFEYSKDHIKAISGVMSCSVVGDDLPIDTITFTVNMSAYMGDYQDADTRKQEIDGLLKLKYATPIWVYLDKVLVGKFYSGAVERRAYALLSITAESALGILDRQQHLGGYYTGQSFQSVISDIVGGVFPFSISKELAEVKVYNWLPIASKRDNIHQLLFAHGANLTKDDNGDMVFGYLDQETAVQVPNERLFLEGTVTNTPVATRVELTEHSFFSLPTDAEVVLFDNTNGGAPAGGTFVAFQEAPLYDIRAADGLIIDEDDAGNEKAGPNYAVVSGIGRLYGKRYNHQTNRVGRDNPDADENAAEKVVSSDGCTLVSVLNSSNVSRRLLSYYASARKYGTSLAVESEKPGDQIRFTNIFGDPVAAFISSMQYNITSFIKARCELITNYQPTPPGGGDFTHVEVITESGTWTVPDGVTEFNAVLIGGGQGGSGGYDGENGKSGGNATASRGSTSTSDGGVGGTGGKAGDGGSGGRVFQVHIEATAGTQFTASIGAGGAGGARNGGFGTAGGNTTFSGGVSSYTSANGAISSIGYFDIIGQNTYGAQGAAGIAGGAGGAGRRGSSSARGMSGDAVGNSNGGTGASRTSMTGGSVTVYEKPDIDSYGNIYGQVSSNSSVTGYYCGQSSTSQNTAWHNGYYAASVDSLTGRWILPDSSTTVNMPEAGYTSDYVAAAEENQLLIHQLYHAGAVGSLYPERYYDNRCVYVSEESTAKGWTKYYSGSGGGGAAFGSNGSNATANDEAPGQGGSGANATQPELPNAPGSGGAGGNGGGGGGGGGGAKITAHKNLTASETASGGNGGSGGHGSAGGDGAPGCVLIYY